MSSTGPACLSSTVALANGTTEVECRHCGLDPICMVLDYAAPGSGITEALLSRRVAVSKGSALFFEGGDCEAIFAVKSGSFKASVSDPMGDERVVGFYLPGELIGVDAIAGQHYHYTLRALESSQVCDLRLSRLADSGKPMQDIQHAMIEILGKTVEASYLSSAALMQQNAEQRLCAFLLTLSERLHRLGFDRDYLRLAMSRSDIASYLGLSRETVSRLFSRLEKDRLISMTGRRLRLLDRHGLSQLQG